MTLEVGRINGRAFRYKSLGDVRVPSRVLAISMSDQRYKPRRSRGPTLDDDAAPTAVELDWLCCRQLKSLHYELGRPVAFSLTRGHLNPGTGRFAARSRLPHKSIGR